MSTVLVIPDIHQRLDAAERMLLRGDAAACDRATLPLHSADGAPFEVAEHGLDPHADARVVKGRVLYRPVHPLLRLRRDLSSYALALRQGTALNTISP